MKISAYVICKNESSEIERCIGSIKNSVDEIVVVDGGSCEQTENAAKNLGAHVYSVALRDDFSYARNFAVRKCSGDWIIALDSDQYFKDRDIEKVVLHIKNIEEGSGEYDGLACMLVNIDGIGDEYVSKVPHLIAFKNTPDLRYQCPVNEQLKKNGRHLNLKNIDDVTVVRAGNVSPKEKLKAKSINDIAFFKKNIQSGAYKASDYFNLTQLYISMGKSPDEIYNAARKMFDLDIEDNSIPFTVSHRKYTLLATAMQKKDFHFSQIMELLDQAASEYMHHPEIFVKRGDVLLGAQKIDYAVLEYETALELEKKYKDVFSNSFTKNAVNIQIVLAELYLICGNPVHSMEHCFNVLKKDKYNRPAALLLLHLIRSQPPADSVMLLDSVYNRDDIEDIKFLTDCLFFIRIPTLLGYYEKILRTKFEIKSYVFVAALLCQKRFETAARLMIEYLSQKDDKELYAMGCAGIILGDLYKDFQSNIKKLEPQYSIDLESAYKIAKRQNVKNMGSGYNISRIFYNIIQSVIDERALYYIESIVISRNQELIQKTAQSLLYSKRYTLLGELFDFWSGQDNIMMGERLFYSGKYFMTSGIYSRALEQFYKAIQCGFTSLQLQEYIRIIKNKSL